MCKLCFWKFELLFWNPIWNYVTSFPIEQLFLFIFPDESMCTLLHNEVWHREIQCNSWGFFFYFGWYYYFCLRHFAIFCRSDYLLLKWKMWHIKTEIFCSVKEHAYFTFSRNNFFYPVVKMEIQDCQEHFEWYTLLVFPGFLSRLLYSFHMQWFLNNLNKISFIELLSGIPQK